MNSPHDTRKDLRRLSDSELLKSARIAVQKEREATAVVLKHFLLVEERRLYALKYPSLFAWATEELGYSEGAAQRRIDGARLLGELPHLAEKIESGALSLTNLSQAKSFFRQEKKAGKNLLPAAKAAVLTSLEEKSSREALKHLVSLSSNPHVLAVKTTLRSLGNGQHEMRLIMTDDVVENLKRIRGLLAHALPDADWPEVIERMAEVTLQRIDPVAKAERAKLAKEKKENRENKARPKENSAGGGVFATSDGGVLATSGGVAPTASSSGEGFIERRENLHEDIDTETGEVQICLPLAPTPSLPTPTATASWRVQPPSLLQPAPVQPAPVLPAVETKRSRVISAATAHEVWLRDRGQCAYVDKEGRRCPSRHALERDHRIAFATGGGNDVGNLRLYCRSHNALHADQTFGREKMVWMRARRMPSVARQSNSAE